ncbi:beta-ketoacyl synthase N-terminal-like domain-containing protein [Amycolatopsis panacis]|uniref:Polyketide synthase n=1 Tax=Amycolatopsis panacis TaxID=2340917 RepID=A0A419HNU7_9PSEU|nr:type I polyketide synthase [Amycolatopsis panacis]RJQ77861.1 polyketide synthase [Amycolatopsis panacis]
MPQEEIEPGDLAVVGMAVNFPGAPDLDRYWTELCAGRTGITRMSRAELLAAGVPAALADDPAFVPAAGLLPDIEGFDAEFFGYGRADAELLDPQHRLFLECAWHALEDAGIDPGGSAGLTGVFAGGSPSTYLLAQLLRDEECVRRFGLDQLILLNEKDLIPSRVSYALDLTGPSVSVQSCSSSALSALAQGCASLLTGESDLVLAGAVSIVVPQIPGYLYREGSRLAPDGINRVFDAGANGMVPGNGLGVVVLRRLEDALAEGDRIYAMIRGWAVAQDGRTGRASFEFPSAHGQASVITEALAMAGAAPADIDHVECNVMGTSFGDVAELSALQKVFDVDGVERVTLGAIDGNLGHLNQAGGIARLIKAALSLHHGKRPPAVNFERPSAQLGHGTGRLAVQEELEDWPRGARPRLAGVSAYGFGGTNAHVVLEEAAPPPEASRPPPRSHEVLIWSALTPEAADAATARLHDHSPEWTDIADVAYTLHIGRKAFAHRRMTVVSSTADARTALSTPDRISTAAVTGPSEVAFLLPGAGQTQPTGDLCAAEPVFRAAIGECGPTAPEVFAVGYALGRLLLAWGVVPRFLTGYGVGEYAAAALAGTLTVREATALAANAHSDLRPRVPDIPLLSNETGEPITDQQLADPQYWASRTAAPARFGPAAKEGTPDTVLVRLGAHPSVHRDFPEGAGAPPIPALTTHPAELPGRLWLSGVDIDWRAYHAGRAPRKTSLPGYVFQHQRYWIEPAAESGGEETAVPYGARAMTDTPGRAVTGTPSGRKAGQ